MRRAPWLVLLFLLAAPFTWADTIVLKSGRRISATNVTVEGDTVYYDTASGRSSVPKSDVARIDLGDSSEPPPTASAKLPLLAPRVDLAAGDAEVARAAVHDGAVDDVYLARLEDETRTGAATAVRRLAVGYNVAAVFEFNRGEFEHSIYLLRRALTFAPDHPSLLLNLSRLQMRRGEYSTALDGLERAERLAPNDADTAVLLGWAYRGANRLDRAVEEWKRALSLRPDPVSEAMLANAQRDLDEERTYRAEESGHFTLRYSGSATAMFLPGEVLRTLETHFRAIESELSYTPPDSIPVILYTDQAFADITTAPSWAGALNDGRIRVPVQGLTSVDDRLSAVLKHELTHSFIRQKTGGPCPTWLNEGVAQWMAGKRSDKFAASLAKALEEAEAKAHGAGNWTVQPAALDSPWIGLSGDQARAFYKLSLAMVEYIIRTKSMDDIRRLLDAIPVAPSPESALRNTLGMDYAELLKQTALYLRRTYPQ